VSSSQSTNIVPSHVGLCLLLLLVGNLHSSLSKLHVQNLIIIMILIFILAIRHLVKFFVVPVATHEIYSLRSAFNLWDNFIGRFAIIRRRMHFRPKHKLFWIIYMAIYNCVKVELWKKYCHLVVFMYMSEMKT
jgi:hypothetical protein